MPWMLASAAQRILTSKADPAARGTCKEKTVPKSEQNSQPYNPHTITWQPDPSDPNRAFGSTADLEFRRTYDPLLDIVSIHSRPAGTEPWSLAGTVKY